MLAVPRKLPALQMRVYTARFSECALHHAWLWSFTLAILNGRAPDTEKFRFGVTVLNGWRMPISSMRLNRETGHLRAVFMTSLN